MGGICSLSADVPARPGHSKITISAVTIPMPEALGHSRPARSLSSKRDVFAQETTKPASARLSAVCITQICASILTTTAYLRLNARNASANAGSSIHEKCTLGRACASSAAFRTSGTVRRAAVGSVGRKCRHPLCGWLWRATADLAMVRAGGCVAGNRRSCMASTTSADSVASISITCFNR